MDYAAQGMFVFAAELSPRARQNENSRYPQLEMNLRGERDGTDRRTSKNTLWGKDKENSSVLYGLSPHINMQEEIF